MRSRDFRNPKMLLTKSDAFISPNLRIPDQRQGHLKGNSHQYNPGEYGVTDFGSISILPSSSSSVQPKLKINSSNDQYEQEADSVAEQVMQMPETVQRKCNQCGKEEESIQTKSIGASGTSASISLTNQIQNSRGGGQAMNDSTRSFMENRFGTNLSGVRIHTNDQAEEMNRGINARAFTVGKDIYFNKGEYNPNHSDGKMLLAHELTHVLQQRKGEIPGAIQKEGEGKKKKASKKKASKKKDAVKTKVEVVTKSDLTTGETKAEATTTRSTEEKVAKGVTASASEKTAGSSTTHSAGLKAKDKKSGLFAAASVASEKPHDPAMAGTTKPKLKVGGQWTLLDASAAVISAGAVASFTPGKKPAFSADGKVVFIPNGTVSPELTLGLLADKEGFGANVATGLGVDITDILSAKAGVGIGLGTDGNLHATGSLGIALRFP